MHHLLSVRVLGLLLLFLLLAHQFIVIAQTAHTGCSKQRIAPFHLANRPAQSTGCLFRVCDNRNQQVRNAVVIAQLDHFRVYHDEPHIRR